MGIFKALNVFKEIVLEQLDQFANLPERLSQAGFDEVAQRTPEFDDDVPPVTLVLHKHPKEPFAFSYGISDARAVSDVALIFHDSSEAKGTVLDFVKQQPDLRNTTSEVSHFFGFAPEYLRDTYTRSRFWTAKKVGQTGMNISLGPALWDPFDGEKAIALTVSLNQALEDPLDDQGLDQLTGPGSRLAKFVQVFSDITVRACPDLEKLVEVAREHGYEGDELDEESRANMQMGPNSLVLSGGKGQNPRSEDITSCIQVNCGSEFRFEFALEFILDPRLSGEQIQDALFEHLGIAETARPEGVAVLELHGQTYTVRHHLHHAAFGNHYFLLQR